jgi:tetratricopeptide (TPR) repeat protein
MARAPDHLPWPAFGTDSAVAPVHDAAAALFEQAMQWQRAGQPQAALGCVQQALAHQPRHFEARCFLAKVLAQLGHLDQALAACDAVLAVQTRPDLLNTRAAILGMLGRHAEALAACDRALALQPKSVYALSNRAMLLQKLGRADDAVACYEHALALFPHDVALLTNYGSALLDLWRPHDALACYERAIALQPMDAEARNGHSNALRALSRFEEALAGFARALELSPGHATLLANQAQLTLLLGDFERGWQRYESRQAMLPPRNDDVPLRPVWAGEPIAGKTILLYGEQGLGDTIQFARYVDRVAATGATVLLEVQPPLKPLFAHTAGVAQLFAQGEPLPEFDCRCSLMSLPYVFGTRLDTIPPQLLHADAQRVQKWRTRLAPAQGLRVGLCWSGSTTHGDDHNRSLALAELVKHLPLGAQFVSLQKDVRSTDAAALAARPDIVHFGDELGDFADTAALVEMMDLVISVDTAVAHLAGAMCKQLWLLLPLAPDWRWMLERDDSPWYPSARLFRQEAYGDWTRVLARLHDELSVVAGSRAKSTKPRRPRSRKPHDDA